MKIRDLRDGYQDLTKRVIEVQEDGKSYFHHEFEPKKYNKMKEAIDNEPEEEEETKHDIEVNRHHLNTKSSGGVMSQGEGEFS